jgi:hypothetical protein
MINLNNQRHLNSIASIFFREVEDFLSKRKEGSQRLYVIKSDKSREYFNTYLKKMEFGISGTKSNNLVRIFRLYTTNLPIIINATANNISSIANRYKIWRRSYLSDEEHKFLKNIFENLYNDFTKVKGYALLKKMNIRTCPYCNRQYTFTINSANMKQAGVKIRPEFDHFYSKSEFPILALSFYNLVPSCPICNHVKNGKEITIHPYVQGFNCKFKVEDKSKLVVDKSNILLLKTSQFRITFNHYSLEEKTNIEAFGLRELYNQHKDYVKEIMDKTQAYDSHARESLINSFQGAGHTPEQVYNFIWGGYLNDAEYEKRPLSKLTKDILDQLEIIK